MNDGLIELIKYIGTVGGATFAIIKAIQEYFKHLNKKLEEASVGLTKVLELQAADNKVKKDIEVLEEKYESNCEDIRELKRDQKEFSNRVWDFMTKK